MKIKNQIFVLGMLVLTLLISVQMEKIVGEINNLELTIFKLFLMIALTIVILISVKISAINLQEILIQKKSIILNVVLWCLNYINVAILITINYFLYLSSGLPINLFNSVIIGSAIGYVLWIVRIFKKQNQLHKLFSEIYLMILILFLTNYLLMGIVYM